MQIYDPMKASSKLSGTAYGSMAIGKTFSLNATTHIKTNAINQLMNADCIKLNFREIT